MRVTENMRFHQVQRTLSSLNSAQMLAAQKAATGQKYSGPSGDPVAAADIARLRSALSQTESYRQTLLTVRGDVTVAENALAEASDLFIRARELAVQGANDSLRDGDREALADVVATLKTQFLSLANTKGSKGYVFSGTATDTPTFDATATFTGNGNEHLVEIAPSLVTRVSISGEKAFTAAGGGRDVYADLDALEIALRANDASTIAATLSGLDLSFE